MNSNNPSEQRAYQRRLKRLRARDRRWGDERSRQLQEINEAYDEFRQERERWERHELRQERRALDGNLRPHPGRRNREIDDGGLD